MDKLDQLETQVQFTDEWAVEQDWLSYSERDHATWQALYGRMHNVLENRICDEFFTGLDALALPEQQVVRFEALCDTLNKSIGWQYVPVSGHIPTDNFFHYLANKRFPSSRFMRDPDGLSYQELPDIFHDVFGHAPLLMHPVMADFMQAFGRAGIAAKSEKERVMLGRLYWFTVEVGLVAQRNGLRAYGAAIASSEKETMFALYDKSPNILKFDHARIMRTPYSMYDLQETYFVIDSMQDLLALAKDGFACVRDCDPDLPDIERGELIASDQVIQKGTGAYYAAFKAAQHSLK